MSAVDVEIAEDIPSSGPGADSAGPEAWFVDPKDAALLRALQMLDERLVELPEEFPDAGIPEPAMRLLARLAGKEVSLRVGRTERAAPGRALPGAAALRVAQPGAPEGRATSRP